MAHTVVIGAGPVGLVAAMLLAAEGQRVTVLDRDLMDPRAEDVVASSAGGGRRQRPGVRQFGQPHILLPGGMRVLDRELPRAVAELGAIGGHPYNVISGAWGAGEVGAEQPGDTRFETLALRRPLVEAALLAAARETPGITLRRERVTGLLTAPKPPERDRPRVTGVVTADGATVPADLVVDASGRDTRLPALLEKQGARLAELPGTNGFRYYSRFFRSPDGSLPKPRRWPLTHHDSVSLITLPADRGTWSVTLVTSGRDQILRALGETAVWDRAAALYPEIRPWLDGEPLDGVTVMGGTATRRHELLRDDRPVVTGLLPVGDAWATTNPQFGMGLTMGFRQAELLRDQLRKLGTEDPAELVLAYDRATEDTLVPLWADSDAWDRHRLAEIDEETQGRTYRSDDPAWNLRNVLDAVRLRDPRLLRAVADVASLLRTPDEALAGTDLLTRVAEWSVGVPRHTEPGPARSRLLTALGAAGRE
ncbi:FAD-dependent monooxygenase [Streptomyces sp. ALI-76-A]|uniref:FAD-dependent oxidoreductase n=1 Tax=Streptomyces sp. ALI-76-A TaxID=3025736 RepID=UPI00256F12AD|nr:FAD-dependent monooxygenase [Streptomyces sp. ALI-76-A]MDL5200011.1 FAD-dependent monooxygenase [Streptomyces sp. ALI-76-A]